MQSVLRYFESGQGMAAVGSLTPSEVPRKWERKWRILCAWFRRTLARIPYKHLSVTSLPVSYSYGQGWPGLISFESFVVQLPAVSGGAGRSGSRLGSPRAPRTSTSSNSSEGAIMEAGNPLCADPKAPRAVPANPFT